MTSAIDFRPSSPSLFMRALASLGWLVAMKCLGWMLFSVCGGSGWRNHYEYERVFTNPNTIDVVGIGSLLLLLTMLAVIATWALISYLRTGRGPLG